MTKHPEKPLKLVQHCTVHHWYGLEDTSTHYHAMQKLSYGDVPRQLHSKDVILPEVHRIMPSTALSPSTDRYIQ